MYRRLLLGMGPPMEQAHRTHSQLGRINQQSISLWTAFHYFLTGSNIEGRLTVSDTRQQPFSYSRENFHSCTQRQQQHPRRRRQVNCSKSGRSNQNTLRCMSSLTPPLSSVPLVFDDEEGSAKKGGNDDRTSSPSIHSIDTKYNSDENKVDDVESAAARRRRLRRERSLKLQKKKNIIIEDATAAAVAATADGDLNDDMMPLIRHDRKAFENLFERLACTVPLKKLVELRKRVAVIVTHKDGSSGNGNKAKTRRKVTTPGSLPLRTLLWGMLQSTNPNHHLQLQLLEFLLSTKDSSEKEESLLLEKDDKPTCDNDDVIKILLLSRRRVLKGLVWSRRRDLKGLEWMSSPIQQKAKLKKQIVASRMALDREKSDQLQEKEATELNLKLRQNLPCKNYNAVIEMLKNYAEEGGIRQMSGNLMKATGPENFHLVAPSVANFLYMNVELEDNVAYQDPRFQQSRDKWLSARDKFVDFFMQLQERVFLEEEYSAQKAEELDFGETDENDILDIFEQEFDMHKPKPKEKIDRRYRPLHFFFNVKVPDHGASRIIDPLSQGQPLESVYSSLPTDKSIIFVDNLPVDITSESVVELFSRCGEVESCQLFNSRPDLDPGTLTPKEQMARRKRRIMSVSAARPRRWQRSRTPVYAMLNFKDREGHDAALCDSLRIFGMVVNKHQVRSICSSDMTSLFVEGLPLEYQCHDIEQKLSEQLKSDLVVVLDPRRSRNKFAFVASCEVKFPSFQLAFESFHDLQDLDVVKSTDGCSIQWLRTRKDAELWWKRELGFD